IAPADSWIGGLLERAGVQPALRGSASAGNCPSASDETKVSSPRGACGGDESPGESRADGPDPLHSRAIPGGYLADRTLYEAGDEHLRGSHSPGSRRNDRSGDTGGGAV